jgi:hypothetical protein
VRCAGRRGDRDLSLHIAKEMLSYPTTYDRAFVADVSPRVRGIDLVIEHGPHVVARRGRQTVPLSTGASATC